jgi:hypothetical protein
MKRSDKTVLFSLLGYNTCSPRKVNRRFRGTSVKQVACRACCICYLLHVDLLGLLFDSEEGGDMFFQDLSLLATDYAALYHR